MFYNSPHGHHKGLGARSYDHTDDYTDRGEIFSRESIVSFNQSSTVFRDRSFFYGFIVRVVAMLRGYVLGATERPSFVSARSLYRCQFAYLRNVQFV